MSKITNDGLTSVDFSASKHHCVNINRTRWFSEVPVASSDSLCTILATSIIDIRAF